MARKRGQRLPVKSRRRLDTAGAAVMRAFRSAKFVAPKFMSSSGIFPEVSEAASDRLHPIVHDLAVKQLNQGRHFRALQRQLHQLVSRTESRRLNQREVMERISAELTAVLAAEATAAYLFGLSVGLTVRSLPDRLDD
jgi:hypothetical protein